MRHQSLPFSLTEGGRPLPCPALPRVRGGRRYGEGWNGGASLWEDVPQCTGNDTSLAPAVCVTSRHVTWRESGAPLSGHTPSQRLMRSPERKRERTLL